MLPPPAATASVNITHIASAAALVPAKALRDAATAPDSL
jgi:hypothetical protein